MHFKDYFSVQAGEYARRRPRYPQELFTYLASLPAEHELALDCGTGNGQAALGLSPYFDEVIAVDPSASQLRNAFQHPRITYVQAPAEETGLPNGSVDLVTVAQAVHWLNIDSFFAEARRVLKPEGVCAVWCYALCRISPEVDPIVDDFYFNVVGPYWPRERALVDDGYASLPFPFKEIEPPDLSIQLEWNLADLLGYLGTWSPVQRYIEANHEDPVDLIRSNLTTAWGDPAEQKQVRFPLKMRVGARG